MAGHGLDVRGRPSVGGPRRGPSEHLAKCAKRRIRAAPCFVIDHFVVQLDDAGGGTLEMSGVLCFATRLRVVATPFHPQISPNLRNLLPVSALATPGA